MTRAFDPYHVWLGIPPKDQPANHYRLLGLEIFEPDFDVIASAADRQMAYVKSHQTGEHSYWSQEILNKIAAARVCLLNPHNKAQYDAALSSGRSIEEMRSDEIRGCDDMGDSLELEEQPADDPPFSTIVLYIGGPTPEQLDSRIEALDRLYESLKGTEDNGRLPESDSDPEVLAVTVNPVSSVAEAKEAVTPSVVGEVGVASTPPAPVGLKEREKPAFGEAIQSESDVVTSRSFDERNSRWRLIVSFVASALLIVGISSIWLRRPGGRPAEGIKPKSVVTESTDSGLTSEHLQPRKCVPVRADNGPSLPVPPTKKTPQRATFPEHEANNVYPSEYESKHWPWTGNWSKRISELTDSLHNNPQDATSLVSRGVAYCKSGNLQQGMADFDRAIRLEPTFTHAYYNRGVAWILAGRYENAIEDLSRTIELNPTDANAFFHRALAWERQGRYEAAAEDRVRGQLLWDMEDDNSRRSQTPVDLEMEYYRKRAAAKEAIGPDPRNALWYRARGDAHCMKEDWNSAIAEYAEAIRLDPSDSLSYFGRGCARSEMGQYQDAIADFTEAIRHNPENIASYADRGYAWEAIGEHDNAIADWRRWIELEPDNPQGYNCIAWHFATCPDDASRNGSEAIKYATKACELTGWKDAFFFDTLAAAHAEAGQYDKAVEWQEKAVANPGEIPSDELPEYKRRLELYKAGKPYREEL